MGFNLVTFLVKYWKPLAVVIVLLGLYQTGYWRGRQLAEARCQAAEMQSRIAQLERDLQVHRDAAAFEDAARRAIESENARLSQEIDAYAENLKSRPDGNCALDRTDVERLRRIQGQGHR